MSDVSITPMENGPYIVRGSVTVFEVDGNERALAAAGAAE